MFATLTIPSSEGVSQSYALELQFRDGRPVLYSSHGHEIGGHYFQFLRDRMGATIETTDVPMVARLLGLSANDPGLTYAHY